ncbi:hypothetical protein L1987_06856 [Smallanthus sonchifolius]|uniref:Uncharacterized protein n=1 Tax=Smallanthus sonchifolius TaxID=185202 RepID=A0ACB9JZB4_9ASTR|nr:hypothetical protein L1987_06856 [Smallanthus sonchifolius]
MNPESGIYAAEVLLSPSSVSASPIQHFRSLEDFMLWKDNSVVGPSWRPWTSFAGKISYNGHGLKECVPQTTSAYVSQQDWHVTEMTVKETLDLAARCQGVGFKYDMRTELTREKIARIRPDEDLDIFMKGLNPLMFVFSLVGNSTYVARSLETKSSSQICLLLLAGITNMPGRRVKLQDTSGQFIDATLWDEHASSFNKESAMQNSPPVL